MKARLPYIIGFVLLVAVEVCIGMFYFSHFIRSYVGDVIIVWVLYCLFRSFVPKMLIKMVLPRRSSVPSPGWRKW